MYTELIQRCKQMYLTESDGEEDSFYQLPSFLDSIASVLIHLEKVTSSQAVSYFDQLSDSISTPDEEIHTNDFLIWSPASCPWPQVPEVYTPLLERLLVVQIDSFPQFSERMQTTCCRSILKVLVAIASKGPVLLSFIGSVGTVILMTTLYLNQMAKAFYAETFGIAASNIFNCCKQQAAVAAFVENPLCSLNF